MTIKYEVKFSQADVNEGRAYNLGFYLDNSETKIAIGKLFGIKTDGATDAEQYDTVPTIIPADASTGVKAVGFVYRQSKPDSDLKFEMQLLNPDPNYYPFGVREDQELVAIQRGAITVIDSTRNYHFNTTKKLVSGITATVLVGDLTTVVASANISGVVREGDLVVIDGEQREVLAMAVGGLSFTVTEAFSGAIGALTAIYIDGDIDRLAYSGANGLFTLKTPQTGDYRQVIGKVVNGNTLLINLELDVNVGIVA